MFKKVMKKIGMPVGKKRIKRIAYPIAKKKLVPLLKKHILKK